MNIHEYIARREEREEILQLTRALVRAKRDLDKLQHLAGGLSRALYDAGLEAEYWKVMATCDRVTKTKAEVEADFCCAHCLGGKFCTQVQVQVPVQVQEVPVQVQN